jgi:hypothetical protein
MGGRVGAPQPTTRADLHAPGRLPLPVSSGMPAHLPAYASSRPQPLSRMVEASQLGPVMSLSESFRCAPLGSDPH